jgi:hypothetical protein
MTIHDRTIQLINWSGKSTADLEKETGIDRYKWGHIKNKRQRVNADHIEAITKLWPEFAYWLTTGKTIPEAGQISPETEEIRRAK